MILGTAPCGVPIPRVSGVPGSATPTVAVSSILKTVFWLEWPYLGGYTPGPLKLPPNEVAPP